MSVLSVPGKDAQAWPSLGPQVAEWIEENLVYGPGDLLGEPAKVDDETRALLRRAYEIWPKGSALEGRRRFTNVAWSLAKGTAKTERAAWVTIAESHPEAPVRFVDWYEDGEPVGWGVTDPFIPLLATTEGQAETTTYEAVRAVLERAACSGDYDIGLGRIVRTDGRGRIEAVATSPDARDGARTTFQSIDETHRLTDDREKKTYQVMLANVAKRKAADGWTLSTTTGFMPGQESVAEVTYELAKAVQEGKHKDSSLFFFHRQANDGHKIARPHEVPGADNEDDVRQAILEAYGPSAAWANVEGMVTLWRNPETSLSYFERVVLNRPVQSESQVFDMAVVRKGIAPIGRWPRDRSEVALGFDGSRTQDATALIGTEIETGYQFVVGFWEKPENAEQGWEVPGDEVDQAVTDSMQRWRVKRMCADHAFWETYVDKWYGKWPRIVVIYPTSALKKTAYAIRNYVQAWRAEEVTYDGNPHFTEHLGNARKRELTMKDEEGHPLYLMQKDRKGSPFKIDAAYAGVLSWEARALAIQGGALKRAGSKAGRTTVYMA